MEIGKRACREKLKMSLPVKSNLQNRNMILNFAYTYLCLPIDRAGPVKPTHILVEWRIKRRKRFIAVK